MPPDTPVPWSLLLQLFATSALTGLIWFVQVVPPSGPREPLPSPARNRG